MGVIRFAIEKQDQRLKYFNYRFLVDARARMDADMLSYKAHHVGDDRFAIRYPVPRVMWLKDGRPVHRNIRRNNTIIGNRGRLRSTLFVTENFNASSDQGIYQCVFIEYIRPGGEFLFPPATRVENSKWCMLYTHCAL